MQYNTEMLCVACLCADLFLGLASVAPAHMRVPL